jgi:hypothetical protein
MSKRARIIPGGIRTWIPALLWLGAAVLMGVDWHHDPYDPSLEGTDAYGHNGPGALTYGLAFSLGELLVYGALIRPWRRERPRGYVLTPVLGLFLFGGWSFVQMFLSMHAGGIQAIHALWLLALDLWLVFEILLAAWDASLRRASAGPDPASRG